MKVASVTGSRRGIGLAIARELARDGYTVVLSDIIEKAETAPLLEELTAEGLTVDYFRCDISNTADRAAFFAYIDETYGRLDVHVNNAGVAPRVRLDILETTEESFDFLKLAFLII